MFLPYYFALNSKVPPYVIHTTIKNGFLNIKLDTQIRFSSNIGKIVKLLRDHTRKGCSYLFKTGKNKMSSENIARVM